VTSLAPERSGGMSLLALTTVGDLAMRPHARIADDTPLARVVDEMTARGRGAVLVEGGGALVGIFTERDLLNRVDHRDPRWPEAAVREVMTLDPIVIRREDSLAEALRRLNHGRRRHLPVVDGKGAVLGLISIRDILSYIAGRFPEEMMNLPPDPSHES
jgi:signal-transduction protein with cAMP-binding, CBS, and nucleotidyltransferase domain